MLTKRQTALQEEHVELKAEHIAITQAHNTLMAEQETLLEENDAFHKEVSSLSVVVNVLEKDNKFLRTSLDNLTGRYEELHETLEPLIDALVAIHVKEEAADT